ncbi:MAG: trypsin-like peptidase domain-containing protein, partial [Pirellulaceae bacterium]
IHKPEAQAKDRHPLAKRAFPSLALQACGAILVLALCADPAHAQWSFGNLFRRSSEARVVSTTPHPAIARITVQEKNAVSFGSGSLIDARGQFGLVVTNWHVVRDATGEISVEFPGGFRSPARLLKVDADWDLAALEIARPPIAPLPISAALPQIGQPLVIAGYGAGNYRAAAGKCKQYLAPKEDTDFHLVEIDVEARQGDSGGPILNERGEIAGVLFGAGSGFTAGSYGGRVRDFLSSVVPGGLPGSDQPGGIQPSGPLLAQSPGPQLNPTSEHVRQNDPFAAVAPHVQDQLRAMAQPPAGKTQVPRNVLLPPPPGESSGDVALVPLPSRRRAPPAEHDPAPSRIDVAQDAIVPLFPPPADPAPVTAAITPADGPPAVASLAP